MCRRYIIQRPLIYQLKSDTYQWKMHMSHSLPPKALLSPAPRQRTDVHRSSKSLSYPSQRWRSLRRWNDNHKRGHEMQIRVGGLIGLFAVKGVTVPSSQTQVTPANVDATLRQCPDHLPPSLSRGRLGRHLRYHPRPRYTLRYWRS